MFKMHNYCSLQKEVQNDSKEMEKILTKINDEVIK